MSATNPATRKILWIQILYSSFGFGLAEWVYILKFLTRCPTPARAIYTFAVAASTTPVLNLSPVSTTADLLYVTKAECVRVYQNIADRINRRETTKQCWPRRENPSPQSSKKYQRKGRTPSRLTINTFRSIQHLTAMKIQYAVNTIIRRVLTQQEIDRCQLAGGIIVSNCGHTCICICFFLPKSKGLCKY